MEPACPAEAGQPGHEALTTWVSAPYVLDAVASAQCHCAVTKTYFFLAGFLALAFSSIAACAAASRAIGTRNGEQLT